MKRSGFCLIFGWLLCSCTTEYNDYFYDSENLHRFPCYSDHYILAKDTGDSLQIWNLAHECNSGFGAADVIEVAKKKGASGQTRIFKYKIAVTDVADKAIALKLNRGGRIIDFLLKRQTSNENAFRVINIVQMIKIDVELEKYIHANPKAKRNFKYLEQGHPVKDTVETMDPETFFRYYREKRLAVAERIINELGED